MTFLAPAWAAGLAAAALPWLAHLLGRRTPRPSPFPAARFVHEAEADTRRFLRLRETALLALRTTAVAAIALAFMQPVWRGGAPAGAADEALGRHVVLIIDRTASMQRTERGHALFDRARRRALAALEQRAAADRISVIVLDRHPRPLLPEPTANRAALAERIAALSPTYEHGDVAEVLRRAREQHRQLDEPERRALHVELYTDAQRSQWSEADVAAAFAGLPAQVRVHRFGRFEANDALHAPAVDPSEPVVGQPVRVSVHATRFAEDVGRRTVELRVGERRQTRRVELEPSIEKTLDFRVHFDEPGAHVIELRFADGDDALAADDATGRVVRVRPHRPVHLITESDTDAPATAAYFVRRALAPSDDAERIGVRLSVDEPAALMAVQPEASGMLVIVEAGALDANQLEGLHDHVAAGGGAIWVIDSTDAVAALARFERVTGHSPMLPISDGNDAWRGASRSLGTGRFDTPILAAFEGPVRAALLDQSFSRTLHAQPRDDAEVLLRFADGAPALATRAIGDGRLAVLAADLAPEASDLAKGPLLVPLLHQLLRHLAPGESPPPNPHPGDAGPGERVALPGFHAHRDEGGDAVAGERGGGVWYELDPRQSDLRVLDELAELDGRDDGQAGDRSLTLVDSRSAMAEPREIALWPWAMLAALSLLLLEPIALLRRTEAQGGRR